MKKCASCSKDLPEAALHCVFCGAKQAAAPAVQPSVAKTAFGYSANEVMDQLKTQPAPTTSPYGAQRPSSGSQPPPMAYGAPNAAANAATMFVAGNQPLQPQQMQPQPMQPQYHAGPTQIPPPLAPPAPTDRGMGIHAQHLPTPQPLPVSGSPYLSSRAPAGTPVEPWKFSLPTVMIVWGVVALVAFATPMSIDPLVFNWNAILHGDSTTKLLALILPAVGVLSIALAVIPLHPLPRGIMAALLGLVGGLLPAFVLGGMPPWQGWVEIAGLVTLVPGLLVRNEYTESLFARVLVTIGALCTLAPFLIPVGSDIPLVTFFKALLEAPGTGKVLAMLPLGGIVLVVLSLLAWMPGPATGGAKVFAWAIILWSTLVTAVVPMIIKGGFIDAVTKTPGIVVAWAPMAVFTVLIGYGLATVLGKRLE